MSDLYNRINLMCKERGTNVTALCRDSKVARSVLSELNMGRTKTITLETAAKLASALGISVDELMGGDQKEKALTTQGGPNINDDDIKFALFGDKTIDDETYESVKNFAKFAAEQKRKRKEGE